jgi:hypothetical protein
MDKIDLKIDWATYEAAKYACLNWHYAKRMPDPKSVKIGAWEGGKFIGVVMFTRGVSGTNISKTLKIKPEEICELSRVALTDHKNTVTRIISIALVMLKKNFPGLRIVISYADENHGHIGAIYQAGNWIYTGKSAAVPLFQDKAGNFIHDRACSATGYKRQFGEMKKVPNRKDLIRIPQVPKWRYFMPLDDEMRKRIEPLRKPYPKRPKQAMTGDQPEQREGSAHPDAPKIKRVE